MTRPRPTDEQRDAAAMWLARRDGAGVPAAQEQALRDWLEAAPGNRQAFDELRTLYAQLEEPARHLARRRRWRDRLLLALTPRRGWLGPAAGVALACGALWLLDPSAMQDWRADIVTSHAPATRIALPDGSQAVLGADTALALHFAQGARQVRLLRGEAYFEVRHGVPGAFTVTARDGRIVDIGTKFNVEIATDAVDVTVTEGAVDVSASAGADPVRVTGGSHVILAGGAVGLPTPSDTERALSWTRGRLDVRDVPVAEVAATLARHLPGRVVVRGGLSGQRISGTFPLDDSAGSLETVAAAAGGTVLRLGPLLSVIY